MNSRKNRKQEQQTEASLSSRKKNVPVKNTIVELQPRGGGELVQALEHLWPHFSDDKKMNMFLY